MVRAEPHRSVMTRHHAAMAEGIFRFWTAPSAAPPPDWADAKQRLTAPSSPR